MNYRVEIEEDDQLLKFICRDGEILAVEKWVEMEGGRNDWEDCTHIFAKVKGDWIDKVEAKRQQDIEDRRDNREFDDL